jgi:hypothetical protein
VAVAALSAVLEPEQTVTALPLVMLATGAPLDVTEVAGDVTLQVPLVTRTV